jgi:F-type H+-transporting ATPase subunit delta
MSSAPEASGSMTLNFNLPHETIYSEAKVSQVIVPGSSGEYGVTADHVPIVAQLKAGVLQIIHEGQAEPEKYFVAGGFSLTHPNSVTDISCPEAVKIDDIDPAEVTKNYEAAKAAFSSSESGSVAQAEAQIDVETNRAMGAAVGLNLA